MNDSRIPRRAICLWALLSLPLAAQAPEELPSDRITGGATITEEVLREWLGTLASPEFEGRGTGQEGFRLAAEYVRDHFEALGLEPGAGDGSFLQVVPWTRTGPVRERTGLAASRDGEEIWRVGIGDGLHGTASQDEEASGPMVFAVTGSAEGEDLPDLDLKGAAVVVVPAKGVFEADESGGRRAAYRTLQNAVRIRQHVADAGGTLLAIADDTVASLSGEFEVRTGPDSRSASRAAAGRGRRPAVTAIPRAELGKLLAAAGVGTDPASVEAPAKLEAPGVQGSLRIDIETEPVPAWNVLAILPGRDPELRDEFVAIGAHLDHLGIHDGTISPGADDDASGSAGVMAIAQAFVKNPVRPRRSILFMAFCGEERGLVGSSYFAAHPTVPLEKIAAELQVDMIGRNEEGGNETAEDNLNSLHLVGSQKLSKDLHDVCLRLNEERAQLDLEWDQEDVFYRSDHWNFAREGVPIAFFFTGFHPDYHKPSDTPDKIDYGKLRRITTYVYDIAFELAEADERPLIDAERWEALERKGRQEPAAPVRK